MLCRDVLIAMSYVDEGSTITRSLVNHSATLAVHPPKKDNWGPNNMQMRINISNRNILQE